MQVLFGVAVRRFVCACLLPLVSLIAQPAFAQPDNAQAPLVVTFSDGSQAELVGIAPHPSAVDKWWHPDGTAKQAPYATMRSRANGQFTREFCWRWVKLGEGTVPRGFSVIEPRAGGYAGGAPRDSLGKRIGGLEAAGMSFNVDKDTATADVRFTAEVGRWRSVLFVDGVSAVAGGQLLDGGRSLAYIVGPPLQVDEDVAVTVSVNLTRIPLRVVGVDGQGKTIEGTSRNMSAGMMTQIATIFPKTELATMRGLRIEERDFEDVTIHNVSLQPGRRTEVEIHDVLTRLGESPSPAKRGLDGRRFRYLQLEKVSPNLAKDAINSLGEANSDETGAGFRAELDDLRRRILLRCNDEEMNVIREFLTRLGEP